MRKTKKTTSRTGTFKININAGKEAGTSYTAGRTADGRYYSSKAKAKRPTARRRTRTQNNTGKKILAIALIVLFVGCWVKINHNNKPQAKAEPQVTEQEAEPASPMTWAYPSSFESSDPPKGWNDQPEQDQQVTKIAETLQERADQYRHLFKKHFGNDYKTMMAICTSESGLIPTIEHKNSDRVRSTDYGICQINLYWNGDKVQGETEAEKIKNLKNPDYNIQIAKQIRTEWQNYNAWSCFKNGAWKKYKNI